MFSQQIKITTGRYFKKDDIIQDDKVILISYDGVKAQLATKYKFQGDEEKELKNINTFLNELQKKVEITKNDVVDVRKLLCLLIYASESNHYEINFVYNVNSIMKNNFDFNRIITEKDTPWQVSIDALLNDELYTFTLNLGEQYTFTKELSILYLD